MMVNRSDKILLLGATGLAGSAIYRSLIKNGYSNILKSSSAQLDLVEQKAVNDFFAQHTPDVVIHAAGLVGGIYANSNYPGDFIYRNLMMAANVAEASRLNKVKKVLYLGSSCIYPKHATSPISESALLTGLLEETNEPYAISKISGIKIFQYYKKQYGLNATLLMPTNLFGKGDNYDKMNSHMVAALIRKIYEAKMNNEERVVLWGTGNPRREIISSEYLGSAATFLLENNSDSDIINIGVGKDYTIKEIANLISGLIDYDGEIFFDQTFPDGVFEKKLNISLLQNLGFSINQDLEKELDNTIKDFITNYYTYVEASR